MKFKIKSIILKCAPQQLGATRNSVTKIVAQPMIVSTPPEILKLCYLKLRFELIQFDVLLYINVLICSFRSLFLAFLQNTVSKLK